MIYKEELVCKGCKYIDPYFGLFCKLNIELGKDEFAQTISIYSVINNKKCKFKRVDKK